MDDTLELSPEEAKQAKQRLKEEKKKLKKGDIEKELDDIVSYLKIESLLEKKTAELNCEEAIMVAIAKALISKPILLILDDVFSKVGVLVRKKIISILKGMNLKYHLTILNVTHDINEIMDKKSR